MPPWFRAGLHFMIKTFYGIQLETRRNLIWNIVANDILYALYNMAPWFRAGLHFMIITFYGMQLETRRKYRPKHRNK